MMNGGINEPIMPQLDARNYQKEWFKSVDTEAESTQ